MSLTLNAMHIILKKTQYYLFEQSQQSLASRNLSLKHILIHTNPSHFFGYKINFDECEDTNTNSTSGITTNNITH